MTRVQPRERKGRQAPAPGRGLCNRAAAHARQPAAPEIVGSRGQGRIGRNCRNPRPRRGGQIGTGATRAPPIIGAGGKLIGVVLCGRLEARCGCDLLWLVWREAGERVPGEVWSASLFCPVSMLRVDVSRFFLITQYNIDIHNTPCILTSINALM